MESHLSAQWNTEKVDDDIELPGAHLGRRTYASRDGERLPAGPHLDSISGKGPEGIPRSTTYNNARPTPSIPAGVSDAGRSEAEWTVSDRGERHYVESHLLESASSAARATDSLSLRDQLIEALCVVEGQQGKSGFIPRGILETIINDYITFTTLTKVLGSTMSTTDIWRYARTICHMPKPGDPTPTFRKVFAILVRIRKPEEIVRFVEHGVSDADIPLANLLRPGSTRSIYLSRSNAPLQALQFLMSWEAGDCEDFEREQWTTVAPYFAKSKSGRPLFFELHEKDVLPWKKILQMDSFGGFSQVFRIAIHENHHEFHDSSLGEDTFAVKRLTPEEIEGFALEQAQESDLRKEFMREVEALRRFSGPGAHPHLVSLLTTFKRGPHFHLVFHWAHSNLYQFWENNIPPPALDRDNLAWMIAQCRGIADGVQNIHEYHDRDAGQPGLQATSTSTNAPRSDQVYGRHTDIKPENILVYKKKGDSSDRGTIKLADFGLCEFHGPHTRSRIAKSRLGGFTPTYRPPEYDMDQGMISRSFDIWMLGCVYLEFITWYLGGWEYFQRFSQARRTAESDKVYVDHYFEIVGLSPMYDRVTASNKFGARVKPVVLQWIGRLHAHEHCSEPIHRFLALINESMLIVEGITEDQKEIKRAPCSEIFKALDGIYRMVTDTGFAVVSSPRHNPTVEWLDPVETDLNDYAKREAIDLLRKNMLPRHNGRTMRKSGTT